jgi:hypothetical protein
VLAWLFGIMLLVMPVKFYQPTGMTLTPMLGTIAEAHGATLIGLGLIDWLARNATGPGLVAVLAGNLVVQILSLAVAVHTMTLGAGMGVAPAVLIHVVLGGLFATFLVRARKAL